MKINNVRNISVPIAVWLVSDDYDYINDPKYISATTLLKPIKQIILGNRFKVLGGQMEADVEDFISSRMGTAIHDAIEKAWTTNKDKALARLGYPEKIRERVVINPSPEFLEEHPNTVPVYLEQRFFKELAGWKIGGKIDVILEGAYHDTKSTSVYSYILGSKDEYYIGQGSIYRWLAPDKITEDRIHIEFIFTDWSKAEARRKPNDYPQSRYHQYTLSLMSYEDTEKWLTQKLNTLTRLWNAPEEQIPPCTDEELWRGKTAWKYYSDAAKANDPTARSSKNFDDPVQANIYWQQEKGGKGTVKTVPGEVKACGYCAAYEICKQRLAYDV
ncbi:exonuclease [Rhizobium phage RHEph22]|uniref:PD-(D/E)XK endonuclease-like domain-containing protein n=1 Tax=Rhizobium phage RHEph22 TaxID=2836135 RepID=A0AAE8AX49_9CAUD|nr:exonuclease [Rhizobium phage RHEph22]QXV74737.1 hypothetical protein [Rhizobium phage RHEph22]QXV74832.1 hypothetical protein [Rhizobium phage RHEph24]